MAARDASAAFLAELAASKNAPAHLVQVQFDAADGGTLYFTDSYRAWQWGGNTYTAAGHLLSFDNLSESAEMRISDVTVQFAGADQTLIAAALTKQYLGRSLLIYKLLIDPNVEALIVDPVLIHAGRMDRFSTDEDPASGRLVVRVTSRDQFADFDRLSGRHTNSNDQSIWFPNDRAFDMNSQLAGAQTTLTWGAPRPT